MTTRFEPLDDASRFMLAEDRRNRILAEQIECTFCWTNQRGHPIGITQAFVHRDGEFWMVSEASRARVRAVRRDPRTSIVVTEQGKSRSLSYKGHTEVIDDPEVVHRVLRDIVRRYDPGDEQAQEAHFRAADSPGRVVLKFTPDKLTSTAGPAQRRN